MKKKIIIYSSEGMKETHDRLKLLTDKMEERENRSMVRSAWNFVSKKPVVGKESIIKKVMRRVKKDVG